MNEYIFIILETMYSAIELSVNMALYKCYVLLLLLMNARNVGGWSSNQQLKMKEKHYSFCKLIEKHPTHFIRIGVCF